MIYLNLEPMLLQFENRKMFGIIPSNSVSCCAGGNEINTPSIGKWASARRCGTSRGIAFIQTTQTVGIAATAAGAVDGCFRTSFSLFTLLSLSDFEIWIQMGFLFDMASMLSLSFSLRASECSRILLEKNLPWFPGYMSDAWKCSSYCEYICESIPSECYFSQSFTSRCCGFLPSGFCL